MVYFIKRFPITQVRTILYHTTLLETMEAIMEEKKNCPVESTLELIGGKYKALILWHLSDKTLRFSELRKAISGATAKMLTQQLRELESSNLIHREVFPIVPPKVEYSLTELGRSLLPILVSMRDWGDAYMKQSNLQSCCFMMTQDPLTSKN